MCNVKFSKSVPKQRDHDHDIERVKVDGVVITSNFRSVICLSCNLKRSPYRRDLKCICHNLGGYDGKLSMKGLRDRRFKVNVLTKTGEKYYTIRVSLETIRQYTRYRYKIS